MKQNYSYSDGFTLTELLVVVLIIGVVTSISAPSMASFLHHQKSISAFNDFIHLIHTTRNQAIQNSTFITICANSDNHSCGRDWNKGQIIFEDKNKNLKVDEGEQVVYRGSNITEQYKVTWRAFQNKRYLRFAPNGMTDWQNGTFRFCNIEDKLLNRAIIINTAGRPRLSKDSNGDGVHEDREGKEIAC